MPTAHLIHGYLGAGKTTLAKQLEDEFRAVRYSLDEWVVALYGDDPPGEHIPDYTRRVYTLINTQWPRVLSRGIDVILDFGFWTRQWRDDVRKLAEEVNATTRLYWVQCGDDTAWARLRARNNNTQGSLYVANDSFKTLRERFEPLGEDELSELVHIDSN